MHQLLIQFQCQREGTLFYYQHEGIGMARTIVSCCPVCGSKRIEATMRTYAAVNDGYPI